ncbi:hypothetical protein ACFL1E_02915 [Candidatus Omnitrophota bacterium]
MGQFGGVRIKTKIFIGFIIVVLLNSLTFAETVRIPEAYKDTSWVKSQLMIYYLDKHGHLNRIRLDGKERQVISQWIGRHLLHFSPNGEYILLRASKDEGSEEEALLVNTNTLEHKTLMPLSKRKPSLVGFSPQGDKIAIIHPTSSFYELLIFDVNSQEKTKINYPEDPKYKIVYGKFTSGEEYLKTKLFSFWSEDGNSLYFYFRQDDFFDLFEYNRKTKQVALLKALKLNDLKEITDHIKNLPRYLDRQSLRDLWSMETNRQSIDGKYSFDIKSLDVKTGSELILQDFKTGETIIIDKSKPIGKDYSIKAVSWSPDYKYVIYINVEGKPCSLLSSLFGCRNKSFIYVYDVANRKKGKLCEYFWRGLGWFDPDHNIKLKQRILNKDDK